MSVTQASINELTGGVALASESGITDARYANKRSRYIDLAFLGGIHIDEPTRRAALSMIDRGRDEFLYDSPTRYIMRQVERTNNEYTVAFNLRSSGLEPLLDAAKVLSRNNAWIEMNAHCRQEEMVSVGCGHSLLRDRDRLKRWVSELSEFSIPVGVKTRAGVGNAMEIARVIESSGGSYIHVDCMDSPDIIRELDSKSGLFIIANNGVRTKRDRDRYLDLGADMVSTARGARKIQTLREITDG